MYCYNLNSIHGLKGRAHNCCQIAMDNLDLRPSYRHCNRNGSTYILWFLRNVRVQARLTPIYDLQERSEKRWLRHPPILAYDVQLRAKELGYPTASKFARKHQTGLYLLCMSNHVMVLRNGRLLNAGSVERREVILGAYKVRPKKGNKGKSL